MCFAIKRVLSNRSRHDSKGNRKWRFIYAECACGRGLRFSAHKDGAAGHVQKFYEATDRGFTQSATYSPCDSADWPQEIQEFLILGFEKPKRPAKPSITKQRAAKAAEMLATWQRKAKLAATKVKAYKKRVAYYAKREVNA